MDKNDIQGNIVAGFNTRFETMVTLAFRPDTDRVAAAQWIGSLAPRVTTVDEVQNLREPMKDHPQDVLPWIAAAISKRVIDAVLPSVMLDDINFNAGLQVRKSAIGDETNPDDWVVGGPNNVVDLLLIIASNDSAAVEAAADDLVQQALGAGFEMTYRETGVRLPGEIEHFGFRDGISQPEIAGYRTSSGFPAGDYVFGYPTSPGIPKGNQRDPVGFTRNGSLLVFLRLEQNVSAFQEFFEIEAARLSPQWPGLTAGHLAALVVGRWPSGALASVAVSSDPGLGSADDNSFNFSDDREGLRCPLGAHIRKVNPRQGSRDVVDVPRIIRRGIPFGPLQVSDKNAKRGLLFVAYQASLKQQFVFLSGSWMNRPDRPTSGSGFDMLVGRASGSRSMPIKGPAGEVVVTFNQQHWINPTGGAYLFAPGRTALTMLAKPLVPNPLAAAEPAFAALTNASQSKEEGIETPFERDGCLTTLRVGLVQKIEKADWPLTRLTPKGAAALPALRDLRHLDLAGQHFPTQILGEDGVQVLYASPGIERLSVHGAAVPGDILTTALAQLPLLSSLDLRGLDLADDDVATILLAHPTLASLSLGATTEERGPHRFHSGRLSDGILQQLGTMRSLRLLSIRGLPLDDDALLAVSGVLTNLEEFDGGETNLGDATLACLAPPARLRRLLLDRTGVTDQGISALAESAHLRDLDISRTSVTGQAVELLIAGTRIVRLAAAGIRIFDDSLQSISKAEWLKELDLGGTGIGDATVTEIARLPLLEKLSIASTDVTSRGLIALATSSLLNLNAEGIPADADALVVLSKMRRLRSLKLTLTSSDWSSLGFYEGRLALASPTPQLGNAPSGLDELRLLSPLTPSFCHELSRLKRLETLSVEGGAEHFTAMADDGFSSLRNVVAESAGLNDTGLDLLGRLPNVEALFISGNSVSAALVRLSSQHLHTLELRDTDVDDRAIEALSNLPRLHCLDLPGTRVTSDGIAELVSAARNLQSLSLDGYQLSTALVNSIADSSSIVEIYLYGPVVTDEVLVRVKPLLRLRELNLYGTSITDNAAQTLISLCGLRTLRVIDAAISDDFAALIRSKRPDIQLHIGFERFPARAISLRTFF